jgi:hypothetical protein
MFLLNKSIFHIFEFRPSVGRSGEKSGQTQHWQVYKSYKHISAQPKLTSGRKCCMTPPSWPASVGCASISFSTLPSQFTSAGSSAQNLWVNVPDVRLMYMMIHIRVVTPCFKAFLRDSNSSGTTGSGGGATAKGAGSLCCNNIAFNNQEKPLLSTSTSI